MNRALHINQKVKWRREQTECNILKEKYKQIEKKRNGERIIEIKLGENIARDTNVKQKSANSS